MTKEEIAAERLTLARQRAERAEQHLQIQKEKEKRLAAQAEQRAAQATQRAAQAAQRTAQAEADRAIVASREARLAEKATRPVGRPKDMSELAVAKRNQSRSDAIAKLKNKISAAREGIRVSQSKIGLAKAVDLTRTDLPDSPEAQARVLAYRASVPMTIARSEGCIREYEEDIKRHEEAIRILSSEMGSEGGLFNVS